MYEFSQASAPFDTGSALYTQEPIRTFCTNYESSSNWLFKPGKLTSVHMHNTHFCLWIKANALLSFAIVLRNMSDLCLFTP